MSNVYRFPTPAKRRQRIEHIQRLDRMFASYDRKRAEELRQERLQREQRAEQGDLFEAGDDSTDRDTGAA
jgi:hypothetical protein